jgi:hypothetical protein
MDNFKLLFILDELMFYIVAKFIWKKEAVFNCYN